MARKRKELTLVAATKPQLKKKAKRDWSQAKAAEFLGVLAENRRLADLPAMIDAYHAIVAAHRGEVTAKVTSAHPLSAEQLKALAANLKTRVGRDVKIATTVDPAILGGLVVQLGSQLIDGSIRTRLNSFAQAMKG